LKDGYQSKIQYRQAKQYCQGKQQVFVRMWGGN